METIIFQSKAAVIAAVNALDNFVVIGYTAAADEPAREADAFATTVSIRGTVREL